MEVEDELTVANSLEDADDNVADVEILAVVGGTVNITDAIGAVNDDGGAPTTGDEAADVDVAPVVEVAAVVEVAPVV